MVLSHGWLAPVAAVCCTLTAAFSGYIIGVTEGHFNAVLPFISTAGCFLPEASIFAQFLNMASFFMIIMFYMRHRQTVEYYGHRLEWEETGWRKMSLVLMGIGIMSAVGLTIVANFRVCEMGLVHAIGALMTFFAILVYCWGQVILSYALVPRMASMPVNHFRFVVVTLATCFLILHELATFGRIFVPKSAGDPPKGWLNFKFFPKDSPFYPNFLVATSAEWVMTIMAQLFFLSFVVELRHAYVHASQVIFKRSSHENRGITERSDARTSVRITKRSSLDQVAGD